MVLPLAAALIPAALGIAEVALPSLMQWIAPGDDRAKKVAQQVVGVAQTITGAETPEAAQQALRADPALLVELQRHLATVELEQYRAETDRLRAENERLEGVQRSLQAEVASGDPYVRRWRPTMGYVLTGTWALIMLGCIAAVVYAATVTPQWAGEVVQAIADYLEAIATMWMVAFGVLGLAVQSRSTDKRLAAGQDPGGLLSGLIGLPGRLAGRRK